MKKTYVIYHGGGCRDGFTSAYVAWLNYGASATYIPDNYPNDRLPENIEDGSDVFILDFTYPRAELEAHADRLNFTILDHHKTAQAALLGLKFAVFDMCRSGAMLTWNHFFPGVPAPKLVQYVQDRDLFTFLLPDSREINNVINSSPLTFEKWMELHDVIEAGEKPVITVEEFIAEIHKDILKNTHLGNVAGYTVPIVNCPKWACSDIGNKLCLLYPDAPFSATYEDIVGVDRKVVRRWSLRSLGFDVSQVAELYGGGGHAQAAGLSEHCVIELPWVLNIKHREAEEVLLGHKTWKEVPPEALSEVRGHLKLCDKVLKQLSTEFKVPVEELPKRMADLQDELLRNQREVDRLQALLAWEQGLPRN